MSTELRDDRDRAIQALADLIDASPRSDWMTSGTRVLEARKLLEKVEATSYRARAIRRYLTSVDRE